MDPASTPLGKMLLEEITPVVMVLRTPSVEEACVKNGLSFVEMLTPFCNFSNIDVPLRTSSDQPYRLRKFKLRLFYESDIRQPNMEVAKERLKQVITRAGEKDNSELASDPPQVSNLLDNSEILPSWFEYLNKELIQTVSFSEHETFDHPVGCLLVVSSKDEQPINKFVDLFNTNKLPALLNDGAMDPKILKHYLLVHDNHGESSEKALKILSEMKSTFGTKDCHLLCINSSQDSETEHQDNPWASYKSDASTVQHLGCRLDVDDISALKDLMHEFSSKHVIPYMEQKVRLLNQQVSATRRGFRNQIKNLWWRKGKDDPNETPSGAMYTFSSIESQIRVLGDHAFMLHDYELALANYRLISTDYKLDKAWKRYAGVQEMMALAYFMLDQSRKEAEYCMENAFSTYIKLGSSGQQNATRCGLWWIGMLKTRDQYKEAATVYFRICNEELLHSAVMLEQASYCYLLSKPPMLYKYGFHLVLSGERYKKSDQIKHAIRTYRSALSIYKETTWSYISDHVHFHIGQWFALLGMYDVAVKHMLEVLACSHQSKTTQELFLREFLQIFQEVGKTFEVPGLQLPVIDISSLKVLFEDQRTYASLPAASVKESLWHSLEEDLIPSLPGARTNWLDVQTKLMPKKYRESNVCVAGEAIKVAVEFKNPLQVPISISSVSLICELSSRSEEDKSDANTSTSELANDDDYKRDVSSNSSSVILSEIDFALGGGETKLVQLTVTPNIEGTLKLLGVRWKFSGCVVGFYTFESILLVKKLARKKKSKHSPLSNLKFVVVKSVPKLEGLIRAFPEKAYAGHLQRLVLELKNQSDCSIKNLKMKISHPRFLSIGNQEVLDVDFPACLEKRPDSEEGGAHANLKKVSQGVFLFPELILQDVAIQGDKPLLWPLWLHAAVPGNVPLYVIIYYEMVDTSSVMKYRTLRLHYNLQVLPSLDVSFKISPSPSRLQEFLVRMDVVNKTSSESFQVTQLSSVGNNWGISMLQPVDGIMPSQPLTVGQAFSFFFMLKSHRKAVNAAANVSALSPDLRSDVMLVPESVKEPLFSTSHSPLADFHDCERSQHGIRNQEDANTVDFILISRPLKSDTNAESSIEPQFFSHHACHCRTAKTSPITWTMSGPRTKHHDFSSSFCEISLQMTVHNSSDSVASVIIKTADSAGNSSQSKASGTQGGWQPLATDTKATVSEVGIITRKTESSDPISPVSPFIWSGSSSSKVVLQPRTSAEIPMHICVFYPGTYDLSSYVLNWNLKPVGGNQQEANVDLQRNPDETRKWSGTCKGYPYFLTVLQL
ncbi:Trafficking protein particle complex subunit 8 [Linum perenne]